MSKKKKYIVKAQNGVVNPPKQEDNYGFDPVLQWMNKWEQAGWDSEITASDENSATYQFSRGTGQYDFHPAFKAFNPLAQLVTGAANKINDIKGSQEEYKQWVRALQPRSYAPTNDGNGKAPVLFQTGGDNRRLTPEEMQQWNQYLDYVKSKGLYGSTDFDSDKTLGAKLLDEFKASNPNIKIGYDIVPRVQNEFIELKKTTRDILKRKGDPTAESTYSDISQVDGWFGSRTSQQYFPSMTKQAYHNGELQFRKEEGLVDGKLAPVGVQQQMSAPTPAPASNPAAKGPKGAFKGEDGFWYIDDPNNPGDVKRVSMQNGGAARQVELEEGEIYQDVSGSLNKIPENAGTHEEGGVIVNDAARVLEDTSDKRKDKVSKGLRLDPDTIELLTGVRPTSDMSHSKAMEFAKKNINTKAKKIEGKLKKNLESVEQSPTNNFAHNSMKFNMLNLAGTPTEGEVFDALFQHQEITKEVMGVNQNTTKAQNGLNNEGRGFARPPVSGDQKKYYYFDEASGRWFKKEGAPANLPEAEPVANSTPVEQSEGFARPPVDGRMSDKYYFDESRGRWFKKPDVKVAGMSTDVPSLATTEKLPMPTFAAPTEAEGVPTPAGAPNLAGAAAQQQQRRNFQFLPQPKSQFNEPLRWFDVAGPIQSLLERRLPVQYDGVDLGGSVNLQHQNALPSLQAGQRDFNAVLDYLPQNSQGYSNAANVFARKYGLDAQVLGQYENINRSIDNQEAAQNLGIRNAQAQADYQAREMFERKWLGSKEAARQQQLTGWDDLYTRLAQNRKLNREGNLLLKLYPAFDQYGEYNGYNVPIRNPLSMPQNGVNPSNALGTPTRRTNDFPDAFTNFQLSNPATPEPPAPSASVPNAVSADDNNGGKGYARPPVSGSQKKYYFYDEASGRWFKKK